jgi:hypothetical protein
MDDRIRQRMADLHELGHRFAVFTSGVPDEAALRVMNKHQAIIERWELVLPSRAFETACARLLAARTIRLPSLWFTKLRGHSEAAEDGSKPFDHSVSLGLDASEYEELGRLSAARDHHGVVLDGVVFRVDIDQELMPNVQRIVKLSETFGIRAAICAKLAPTRSAASPPTDHAIANRVAEVILCAWCNPHIEMFLDTFQDIDRGYFLRPGLIDRRFNPRLAGLVFREFQLELENMQPCELLHQTTSEASRNIAFRARETESVLWLPHNVQRAGTKLGNATPLVPPDRPDVDISGPWIEVTLNSSRSNVQ